MNDAKRSYRILELLQHQELCKNGICISAAQYRESYMDYLQSIKCLCDETEFSALLDIYENYPVPTKYQDPYAYKLIYDIAERIYRDKDNMKMPVFGTAEIDTISAEIRSAGGEFQIILFSNAIFVLSDLICKIIISFIYVKNEDNEGILTDKKTILNRMRANRDAVLHFCDILLCYQMTNNVIAAKHFSGDKSYHNMVTVFSSYFEIFVFAHEFSHHLLGHMESEKSMGFIAYEEYLNVEQISRSWNQELMADLNAALIIISLLLQDHYPVPQGLIGVVICLNTLEILEQTKDALNSCKKGKYRYPNTHPPSEVRKDNIITNLRYDYPQITIIADIINFIFENLWHEFYEVFNALKDMIKAGEPYENIQRELYLLK